MNSVTRPGESVGELSPRMSEQCSSVIIIQDKEKETSRDNLTLNSINQLVFTIMGPFHYEWSQSLFIQTVFDDCQRKSCFNDNLIKLKYTLNAPRIPYPEGGKRRFHHHSSTLYPVRSVLRINPFLLSSCWRSGFVQVC